MTKSVSAGVWRGVAYIAPVVVAVVLGGMWIALSAGGGRAGAHTLWQLLAVAENAVALLLRRRKSAGSLAGILVVYVVTQLYVITLLPVLVALFAVARTHGRWPTVVAAVVTAAVTVAVPYLEGGRVSALANPGLVAASVAAVTVGGYVRAQRLGEPGHAGATSRDS